MVAKRKASIDGPASTPRVPKGRTMGSDKAKDTGPVKELRAARVMPASSSQSTGVALLPVSTVQTLLRVKLEQTDTSDCIEGINSDNQSECQNLASYLTADHSEINYRTDGKIVWLDFLPSAVLDLVITESFVAVACEDATLNVYSTAGRRWVQGRLWLTC